MIEPVPQLRFIHHTDAGNAAAFALLHANRFRYDHTRGRWLVWNGRYWAVDETNEADRAALETTQALHRAALTWNDREAARDLSDWAFDSESVVRRQAMLKSAQSILGFATTTANYDRNPYLLTVGNGTIDLMTGELYEPNPQDLITLATEIPYDPVAKCPRWEAFLDEVFAGDKELIDFIWRAVGYSLSGSTEEQCLFILFGGGANGKTTFLEILLLLVGTHAATTPFSTFLVQRNPDRPRNDVARLHAARIVKAAEAEHESALDEAVIKEVTGGDTVSARFLYKEAFEFKPQFKVWLTTNYKPRIRLIPFTRQFSGGDRDPRLREKLEAELSGILAWAVAGHLAYLETRLGIPSAVATATGEYRQESDQVRRYLNDCCALDPKSHATGRDLYENYKQWCAAEGEKSVSNGAFARALVERGIIKKRGRTGVLYEGVALLPRVVRLLPGRELQDE